MGSGTGRAIAFVLATTALAGCGSSRFGGSGLAPASPARQARVAPEPAPVEPLPSGSVASEPLPPPPGAASAPSGSGAVMADVPTMPGSPQPIEPMAPAASPPAAPSRSGNVGGWTARDATGATCRVTLSSTPSLDLYRASAGGCPNKDLSAVTAWDFRDGEVYLYQPGGAVAARLRGGAGNLSGVLAKSGAPLTLTR